MSHRITTPLATTPTPDALRLSRLDRLIDQVSLGEQHVTIRQQGVSIVDLAERLKSLESTVQTELTRVVQPLKEVDVNGELSTARNSIDRLTQQVALLMREREEAKAQRAAQVQRVEQRQAALELKVEALAAALDQRLQQAAEEQGGALDALRELFSTTLSQVIGSVADQFDAVQHALDEAISGRAEQENEQGRARQLVQESLAAQRQWVEQQQAAVAQQLHAAADRLTAVEQRVVAVEQEAVAAGQGRAGLEAQLVECCTRFAAAEEQAQQAAEAVAGSQEQAAVQEARLDSLWQRVEQGERDWRQLAQAPLERIAELEQRLAAREEELAASAPQPSAQQAAAETAWEHLYAEVQAGLAQQAQQAQQQEARLGDLQAKVDQQQARCAEEARSARDVAEQAQRSCGELQASLASLASIMQQVQAQAQAKQQQQEAGSSEAAAAAAEQHKEALARWQDEWGQRLGQLEAQLRALEERGGTAAVAESIKAAAAEWQRAAAQQVETLAAQLAALQTATSASQEQLGAKLAEYRGYVKRLRKEVQQLAQGHGEAPAAAATAGALEGLRREFACAQESMEGVHMEALGLAGDMERVADVAVSLHTTLRGGWQRGKAGSVGVSEASSAAVSRELPVGALGSSRLLGAGGEAGRGWAPAVAGIGRADSAQESNVHHTE